MGLAGLGLGQPAGSAVPLFSNLPGTVRPTRPGLFLFLLPGRWPPRAGAHWGLACPALARLVFRGHRSIWLGRSARREWVSLPLVEAIPSLARSRPVSG